MASKRSASAALFLALNLVLFALVSSTTPPSGGTCPIDALQLSVCANILGGLVTPYPPCCSLISGLVDLEAALCLCAAIKANVLGIHLTVPITLTLILNNCGKNYPPNFQCPL